MILVARREWIVSLAGIFLGSMLPFSGACRPVGGNASVPAVAAAEIEAGRVRIAGLLGYDVGELVDIRGLWVPVDSPNSLGPTLVFEVDTVNDERLDHPVRYAGMKVKAVPRHRKPEPKAPQPNEGEVWHLRGFERCLFDGLPSEACQDEDIVQSDEGAFRFVIEFWFVSYEVVEKDGEGRASQHAGEPK